MLKSLLWSHTKMLNMAIVASDTHATFVEKSLEQMVTGRIMRKAFTERHINVLNAMKLSRRVVT